MACPYFRPLPFGTDSPARIAFSSRENAMLPLGDSFSGHCCATPELLYQPDPAVSRDFCNLGYARGQCGHFPGGDGPDAVRFTISADQGGSLRLYYVLERDHHPFAHGPLEYSVGDAAFFPPPATSELDFQARAYVASYLRRKAEASGL
jgi:hypothetical protein